jgi:hypothetical protein
VRGVGRLDAELPVSSDLQVVIVYLMPPASAAADVNRRPRSEKHSHHGHVVYEHIQSETISLNQWTIAVAWRPIRSASADVYRPACSSRLSLMTHPELVARVPVRLRALAVDLVRVALGLTLLLCGAFYVWTAGSTRPLSLHGGRDLCAPQAGAQPPLAHSARIVDRAREVTDSGRRPAAFLRSKFSLESAH